MNIGSTTACFPRRALLVWLALILLLPNSALGQEGPGEENRSEPVLLWHKASALFPIRVHLPEGFDSTRTYPAVIALHGYGSSSEQFERVGRAFAQAGFLTVVPEGPYPVSLADSARHSTWELSTWLSDLGVGPNLTDDPAIEAQSMGITAFEFLPSVVDRIQEQYRVGPLYAFGFSLGGAYALGGGFYNRDLFEGIIAFGIGSGIDRELFTMRGSTLEDGSHLKVRLVLGRSDRLVPFSEAERLRDLLKTAGYDVTLDAFDGGHEVPDDALRRAVTWLNDLTNDNSVKARDFKLIHMVFSEIWSKGNVELVGDLFAEDFVGHFPGQTLHGRQALVNAVQAHRASFPDWTEEIKDTIADRDRVVVRFRSRGTNLGEFLGNPPTRNHVEISEVAIFRLSNGKIIEQWVYPDMLSLQRQLGKKEQ